MSHRPIAPEGRAAAAFEASHFAGKPCPQKARPFVLAATILASAMAFIDGNVVNIALPRIQTSLGAGLFALQWVVNIYLLILGALILVGGGLGDRVGRRRIFVAGIIVFAAASLACALAPTIGLLIAARAIQGLGAALLVPQSLAIIAANFPEEVRGRAIGTWAAAAAVTTALGPPVGGVLIDLLSWRAAFWINLPLAVLAIWLSVRFVPESRDESATGRLDWQGVAVAFVGFGALTYGLSALAEGGAGLVSAVVAIIAGVIGVAAFVAIEAGSANPIMPLRLFRSPVFAGTNVVTVFLYGSLSGIIFLLPFDLLARRGLTGGEAGLALLPMGLIIGTFSRFTGDLADSYGPRPFLVTGSAVVGIGCLGFAAGLGGIWLGAVVPMAVAAAGMAIVVSPLTTAVMNAVPSDHSGAASGINNAASRLAGSFAIAAIGAAAGLIFASMAPAGAHFGEMPPAGADGHAAVESAFVTAYSGAMAFAALWAFAASAAAFFFLRGVPAPKAKKPGGDGASSSQSG